MKKNVELREESILVYGRSYFISNSSSCTETPMVINSNSGVYTLRQFYSDFVTDFLATIQIKNHTSINIYLKILYLCTRQTYRSS